MRIKIINKGKVFKNNYLKNEIIKLIIMKMINRNW